MNVLVVNQSDVRLGGGQEVLVRAVCEALSQRHAVTLLMCKLSIRALWRSLRIFYDVVHIHNPLQPFSLLCLLCCRGSRVVVSFHSRRYSPFFIRRLLLTVWRRVCLCIIPFFADVMIYNCENDRRFFERSMLVKKMGFVVGSGVDISFFSSPRTLLHTPPRVVFVGHTLSKGLKCARALRKRMPDIFFDCIVGGRNRAHMVESYRNADIFFQPSHSECYPTPALVEAMASGLPSVVGDVGGIREVIDDGVHGFIVSASDILGYERALRRLLNDRVLYSRMSKETIQRARERYLMIDYVSRIERSYYV